MKFITLGNTPVPALGFGTYRLTGSGSADIISEALKIGYRHIDTAQLYDNEKEVGEAIIKSQTPREDIFLVTKVWPSNFSKSRFIPSVKESLLKLKTDYVDLLLIHWPHPSVPAEDYIPFLVQALQMGLTRNIGVSNFNIDQLSICMKLGAPIVTNQVEFHPWINQSKLQEWMTAHHLPLIAHCPLAKGKMFESRPLAFLAAKYYKSPAQIILRWAMQKQDILAIPHSSKVNRLLENFNIFDFEIAKNDMSVIDSWKSENRRFVGAQTGAMWD